MKHQSLSLSPARQIDRWEEWVTVVIELGQEWNKGNTMESACRRDKQFLSLLRSSRQKKKPSKDLPSNRSLLSGCSLNGNTSDSRLQGRENALRLIFRYCQWLLGEHLPCLSDRSLHRLTEMPLIRYSQVDSVIPSVFSRHTLVQTMWASCIYIYTINLKWELPHSAGRYRKVFQPHLLQRLINTPHVPLIILP